MKNLFFIATILAVLILNSLQSKSPPSSEKETRDGDLNQAASSESRLDWANELPGRPRSVRSDPATFTNLL